MIIVSYDFVNNKKRAKFAKFLKKYGYKLQYSVYQIKNSQRILDNIMSEIELVYKKNFDKTDNILIFNLCQSCQKKIRRYGSAKHYQEDVVYF